MTISYTATATVGPLDISAYKSVRVVLSYDHNTGCSGDCGNLFPFGSDHVVVDGVYRDAIPITNWFSETYSGSQLYDTIGRQLELKLKVMGQ